MRPQVFRTPITDLFGIRHPILCGGLMWLSDARFVAAAVNAGAMGFITALSFPDDAEGFRRELAKCRELTGGKPFGASLAMSLRPGVDARLTPFVDAVIAERVRFVETSGGNPASVLPRLKEAGCVVMHKVPAVRYAVSVVRQGVDAIAVVGGEAGGHPGIYMVGNMVQAVLAADAIDLPLAIGGGMGTGRHLAATLALGGDAMLLGTRMLVAEEIWAHPAYKERVVAAGELDSTVVLKTFRHNIRVLINESTHAVEQLEAAGVTDYEAYRPHVAGTLAKRAYETGDVSRGMISIGPAAAFADRVEPVEAIIDRIIDEAQASLSHLQSLRVDS